jgi:hypothetical protein
LAGLENYDDSALQTAIDGKVDKESGKSLMTDAERTKLQGIAAGAEVNVQPNWTQTNTSADDYIKNKPTLANVATSGSYNDLQDKPTIPAGVTVDQTITQNGTNPVQSSAIYSALQGKVGAVYYEDVDEMNADETQNSGTLAFVDDGSGFHIWSSPDWMWYKVVISDDLDSYVPITRKINNKPLSNDITLNASDVGALPASTTIPTKVSDLTNDAGYTTNTGTVTGISVNGGTAQQPTNGVVNLTVATGGDNDIVGISDGTAGDGAVIFTKRNGDTITLNLNHVHSQYLKYELLADEAAYTALATKDSSTLYLIPAEEE